MGLDVVRRNNVMVTERDDGPVVMLAHGFGCDQNMWRLVAPDLAADFRVVLFDGAGRSDLSAWDPVRYESLDGVSERAFRLLRWMTGRPEPTQNTEPDQASHTRHRSAI